MLYKSDLDQVVARGCDIEGCTHKHDGPLFIHARCHMDAGVDVRYFDGVIDIMCRECQALVLSVVVAHKPVH